MAGRVVQDMSLPRFIPKRVFQVVALLLLVACLVLTICWVATDTGLYSWFRDVLGRRLAGAAILLTFLALFVGWLIVVVPLRKLSTMPTLAEEIGHPVEDLSSLISGLKRLYAREAAKNEAMYRAGEPLAPEMRQRARTIGVAFVIAGIGFGAAAGLSAMVSLHWGRLIGLQIVLALLSPALLVAGLYQVIAGRSVIRKRDECAGQALVGSSCVSRCIRPHEEPGKEEWP